MTSMQMSIPRYVLLLLSAVYVTGCGTQPDNRELATLDESGLDTTSAVISAGESKVILENACAFTQTSDGAVLVREASAEAEIAISRIVDHTGLPKNFVVLEADIDNAVATVVGQDRVIVYSPELLDGTDWSSLGLIAHEIGHHLSGHTLRTVGRMEDELEADRFAGFVLGKMGATSSEAQAVMTLVPDEGGSSTHPPKAKRVNALESGWIQASLQKDQRSELISPRPLPDGVSDEVVFMKSRESRTGCGFETFRGRIVQAFNQKDPRTDLPAHKITIDLEGFGRKTFYVLEDDLSRASKIEKNHFWIIATEGRRVEVEIATCGSAGFESLSRIKAISDR